MLVLVIGGSGSGKSEYAEQRILEAGEPARYYVATMEPHGEEGQKRIARHRKLRAGKGFTTIECPTHLEKLQFDQQGAVLLEDLSNLLANEIWSEAGGGWTDDLAERVCQAVLKLEQNHRLVVVVGNDIHREDDTLSTEMERFVTLLGECQAGLAAAADEVTEVVCGIPLQRKRRAES